MKLFEIAEEFNALYELANETDDTETLTQLFEQIESELEDKADNTRLVIDKLKSDGEFLKNEADRLLKRKRAIDNNINRLKELLAYTLQTAGIEKLKTKKATFYFKETPKVIVEDVDNLPDEFKKIKIEPDKTKLKKALQEGLNLDGAKIEYSRNLIIR